MREAIQTFLHRDSETHAYYCDNCNNICTTSRSNPTVLHIENGSTPNSCLVTYVATCQYCGQVHMFYQSFYGSPNFGIAPTQHPAYATVPLLARLHNFIYTYASSTTLRNYKNRQNNPIYNELSNLQAISYSTIYCSFRQILYKLYEADRSHKNIKRVKKLIQSSSITLVRSYIEGHPMFETFKNNLYLVNMLYNYTYRCSANSSDFHFLQSVVNPEHIKFVNSLDRLNRECYNRSTESEVLNDTQTT